MLISTTIVDHKIVFPEVLFYVKELYLGNDPFNPQALCSDYHCRVEKAKFENCLCRTRMFLLILGLQSVNTLSLTTLLSRSRRKLLGYFKTISSKTQIRKPTTTKHQSDKNDVWKTRNSEACPSLNLQLMLHLQGFAPSATISMRREDRLTSL